MGSACACAPAPGARSSRRAVAAVAFASPAEPRRTSRQVLPKAARLRTADEFRTTVRRGVRSGRPSLVLHMLRTDHPPSRAGFVVSKAVGNAVRRNRVKRQLRHLVAEQFSRTPVAVDVVVRALPAGDGLAGDLRSAWAQAQRRLGVA